METDTEMQGNNDGRQRKRATKPKPKNLHANVVALRDELRKRFPEREDVIDGLLTALVAQHHILLISVPGTAKSAMARAVCDAIDGAEYFFWLMTKYTEPNEVFGPVDLMKWSQDGTYSRSMDGYFPTAHLALLDEVFKCNSAMLNAFLTAINEREFHDKGQVHSIPLRTLIGASNEFPQGAELSALYDRFALRYMPAYVRERDNFKAMLRTRRKANRTPMPKLLSLIELDEVHDQAMAMADAMSEDVEDALFNLRTELAQEGIVVSDRRWVQVQEIVAAFAYMQGDTVVDPLHFEILKHSLWNDERERQKVAELVTRTASPKLAEATELFDAIMEQVRGVPASGAIKDSAPAVIAELKKAINRIDTMQREASGPVGDRIAVLIDELKKEHAGIRDRYMQEMNL